MDGKTGDLAANSKGSAAAAAAAPSKRKDDSQASPQSEQLVSVRSPSKKKKKKMAIVPRIATSFSAATSDAASSTTNLNHGQQLNARQTAELTAAERRANKKITKKHPEFELTYDMMLGIRTVVSGAESSMMGSSGKLGDGAFATGLKYRFPKGGSSRTPGHQMRDFKFKDYAPDVFRQLRHRFDIDPAEYLLRLCSDFPFLEFISNSKSGQFFFYTHDRQYMIKTQTKQESLFLRKILPEYYKYVCEEPNTLLARYFGMHRVKPHKRKPMYFVIMSSVFYTPKFIHEVYDLKGSRQGRAATEKERNQPVPMLKDNDFVDRDEHLRFGTEKAKKFKEQLRRDCDFLRKLKIMDYSLLVGIHYDDHPIPAEETAEATEDVSKPPLFSRARSRSHRSASYISQQTSEKNFAATTGVGENKKRSASAASPSPQKAPRNSHSAFGGGGGKDKKPPLSPKRNSAPIQSPPSPITSSKHRPTTTATAANSSNSPQKPNAPTSSAPNPVATVPPDASSPLADDGGDDDSPTTTNLGLRTPLGNTRIPSSQDSLPPSSPNAENPGDDGDDGGGGLSSATTNSNGGRFSLNIDDLSSNQKNAADKPSGDQRLKSVSFNGVPSSLSSKNGDGGGSGVLDGDGDDQGRARVSSLSHHRAPSSYAQSEPSIEEDSMGRRTSARISHLSSDGHDDGAARGEHKRRQSNYGYYMKKNRKQQITSPYQIDFRAPELESVDGAAAVANDGAVGAVANDEVKGASVIPEEDEEALDDSPPRTHSLFSQDDGGIRGKTADGKDDHAIYFVGIIDILQQYNAKKALEHMVKGIKYDASTISAVKPSDYANRLNKFLEKRIV